MFGLWEFWGLVVSQVLGEKERGSLYIFMRGSWCDTAGSMSRCLFIGYVAQISRDVKPAGSVQCFWVFRILRRVASRRSRPINRGTVNRQVSSATTTTITIIQRPLRFLRGSYLPRVPRMSFYLFGTSLEQLNEAWVSSFSIQILQNIQWPKLCHLQVRWKKEFFLSQMFLRAIC